MSVEDPISYRQLRLPRRVHVGRGYVVQVRLIAHRALADVMGELDKPRDLRSPGGWDVEVMTIWLDRTVSKRIQWETYWHELGHAVHDVALMDRH